MVERWGFLAILTQLSDLSLQFNDYQLGAAHICESLPVMVSSRSYYANGRGPSWSVSLSNCVRPKCNKLPWYLSSWL